MHTIKERENRMIKRNKKNEQDASPPHMITSNNSNFVRSIMALSMLSERKKTNSTYLD